MAVDERKLSVERRRRIPSGMLMIVDHPVFWSFFGLGLAVFLLHGPMGPVDANGVRYLAGPWLCTPIAAALHALWPYHPFRGTWARLSSMDFKDGLDADRRRLTELFQSHAARRFLLRTTLRTSLLLFVSMTTLSVLHRRSLSWTLVSPWLGQGLIGGVLGAYLSLKVELLSWAVSRWARPDEGSL